jgi:predicted NBD/HSP70 family sugar kinase
VDEVVVGGGVVGVGDRYLLPLTDALHAALPHGRRPPVVAARRGPEASVVGAGLLAFERHGFGAEVR